MSRKKEDGGTFINGGWGKKRDEMVLWDGAGMYKQHSGLCPIAMTFLSSNN